MKRKKTSSALYEYLAPFLETGDPAAITAARKTYTRTYKATWRKDKRRREKEVTNSWKPEEYRTLAAAAKKHKTSIAGFVKKAVMAYLDKRYIVPDQVLVLKIAQLLALTYNSITELMDEKHMPADAGTRALEEVRTLEKEVLTALHNPLSLGQWIRATIRETPSQKKMILEILEQEPN